MNRRLSAVFIIVLMGLTLSLFAAPPTTDAAQFIIASWDFPADDYGQGIELLQLWENSTGSWLQEGDNYLPHQTKNYRWNISVGLKIRCWGPMNSTHVGVSTTDEGKNYIRHNITVISLNGTTVFSQQNFTYNSVVLEGIIYNYSYDVILEFTFMSGENYRVVIYCEIYY